MRRTLLPVLLGAVLALPAAAQPVPVVAAENFYGDLARQVGGDGVAAESILSNPDQDPHLFEASPSVARALAGARIVIENGADYDPWMAKLLAAGRGPAGRQVVVVADLVGKHAGDNPHLWYDPATMPAVARALAAALDTADPAGAAGYDARLQDFLRSLQPLDERIAAIRARHAGVEVAATEPVFGYMADALGLHMREARFQLAVMNDTEPRASDVAAFEADLGGHKVALLLYNSQATNAAARRVLGVARKAGVPVVGVTETEPAGKTYQAWMLDQLDAVDRALSGAPRR
jgi:zinc/manganese transport system substrate-binding protein